MKKTVLRILGLHAKGARFKMLNEQACENLCEPCFMQIEPMDEILKKSSVTNEMPLSLKNEIRGRAKS